MIRREITTPSDRLFSRRRFIYYSAALAAAVACGPAAAPAPGSAAPSASGPVQLKGTKVNLLHWTSFVPDEDKWFKETLQSEWAKPNGVDLTIELVAANEAQPKIVVAPLRRQAERRGRDRREDRERRRRLLRRDEAERPGPGRLARGPVRYDR